MISYEIDGRLPIDKSTVTFTFSKLVPVGDIINNLSYIINVGGVPVYPIQRGKGLSWTIKDGAGKALYELTAPYQPLYEKMEVSMPRGLENKFAWKDPATNPILAVAFVGTVVFTIRFSQTVTAGDILSYLKIGGRDCLRDGGFFVWRKEGFTDIKAPYAPEACELEIQVPNDGDVTTIQWTAAEPIPIEQMYHKPCHTPFYPKTAFEGVVDHNGNTLSQVMADVIDRITKIEPEAKDAYEKMLEIQAMLEELDLDGYLQHKEVDDLQPILGTAPYSILFYLKQNTAAHEKGFYVYDGTKFIQVGGNGSTPGAGRIDWIATPDGDLDIDDDKRVTIPAANKDVYGLVKVDDELSDVSDNPVANKAVYEALQDAGKVKDVLVAGASVVDADGNANIELDDDLTAASEDKAPTTKAVYDYVGHLAEVDTDGDGTPDDPAPANLVAAINKVAENAGAIDTIATSDGDLTITDKKVTIPDATDTEKGLVNITTAFDGEDEERALTGKALATALDDLDLAETGGTDKILTTIQQEDGTVTATAQDAVKKEATPAATNAYEYTIAGASTKVELPKATDSAFGEVKLDKLLIDTASTAKTDDPIILTGKAIEDSLAWKKVNGVNGAIQSYTGATASGVNSLAFGNGAKATGESSIALGDAAEATGVSAVAIRGEASFDDAIAIGGATTASGESSIAIGNDIIAAGNNSGAFGSTLVVRNDKEFAFGFNNLSHNGSTPDIQTAASFGLGDA